MSLDTFREETRAMLYRMLYESRTADHNLLVDHYAEQMTRLFAAEAHTILNEVLKDSHTRLDARLAPDPVSQGIANVQTTMQDLWRSFWD